MAKIISNSNEFFETIKEGVTLVDFYADWCGPCRMLAPVIDKISEDYKDKIKVVKINVDNVREVAIKYGIQSIPTLIVIKDGSAVKMNVGFISYDEIKEMIDAI